MAFLINPFWSAVIEIQDDYESYSPFDGLDTLNGGTGFAAAWVSRSGVVGLLAEENYEEYSASDGLDTLNGGSGWGGAWVSR